MKQHNTIIFVPFNIRNKIIAETGKDVPDFPINEQYELLLSYMNKEDISTALEKRKDG